MGMRGKKKISTPVIQKPPQNKLKSIVTKDEKQFKVMDSLLIKHSNLIRQLLEGEKFEEEIKLPEIDSESFEYVLKYMQHFAEVTPLKIIYPLKTNQDPKYIMEEPIAQMITTNILNIPDNLNLFHRVLEASNYLQIEEFKKRLLACLTIRLMKSTVDELKEEFEMDDVDFDEEKLRIQCREKLSILAEIKDD